ncbi:unnamed protein product [Rotaria socialis]|uniref:Uncharacterized protein n=3 Tax=Rotaria socialis TaxID=392032 RepID=A0A820S1N2_9BILA|nr:unnamed protein product [Rotaria socialis]CAF3387097.1 unnamed protein product [Rotaria socialis]CAF3627067.1 unnamed protein product [Rotaria socialis]CAF3632328.1 unnamed protein product [Rotaria socialis]CAF3656700.1 unnamed protein product [Rotaria socialis]
MDQPIGDAMRSTYRGSHIFSFAAKRTGLGLDQFNFLIAEILAFIFAICFRRYLPPKPNNLIKRHLIASLLGIALGQFCFGSQIWHLIVQSCVSYLMLCIIPPKHSFKVIFVFCMIYMSAIHIHRLIYDYGNYTLDISGPLMINTQKLTALAFAFYDGYRSQQRAKRRRPDDDKDFPPLNADQEKQKITDIPHPIEFLSYVFYFHGICVGPLCFYKDYLDYIEGRNLLVIPTSRAENTETSDTTDEYRPEIVQPSTFWPVCTKLAQCALWGYILLFYTPYFTIEYNISKEMVNSPLFKRIQYLLFSTFCTRAKYYFAFILAEAINNAGGLGLNGVDDKGRPKWNLLTNIKPFQLETATSLKAILDLWNMQTVLWLRRICYDRMTKGRTLSVFVLSALWHGFYPGYYVCFVLAAFETYAGRGIRRTIRPYFQKNQVLKIVYACITWFGAQLALNFAVTPFSLMEIQKVWYFYKTWYFFVPVVSVILALTLNGASTKSSTNKQEPEKTKSN